MTNPFPVDINPAVQHVPLTTPRDYTRAIVREIAERHGVSPKAIWTGGREHTVIRAKREAIAAIIAAKPHLSFPEIGRMFGIDHSTAMHHAHLAGITTVRGKQSPNQSQAAE